MNRESETISARVLRVLQQFTHRFDDAAWGLEKLSEGTQAGIFVVRRHDRQPVLGTESSLVVKLYKSNAPANVEVVRDQFEALARLNARLNGTLLDGWTIYSPVALVQCDQPLALVMTLVPGKPLKLYLQSSGQAPPEALEAIAHGISAAMERYWLGSGRIYGELSFDNILCDLAERRLSFVDPGWLERVLVCDSVSRHWYPASRDLGYMLYDCAASVRATIGNPGSRQRGRCLTENILRAFLERIDSVEQKHSLLEETRACAQKHLETMTVSLSPRGLWYLVARRLASRNIDAMLGRIQTRAAAPHGGLACVQDLRGHS